MGTAPTTGESNVSTGEETVVSDAVMDQDAVRQQLGEMIAAMLEEANAAETNANFPKAYEELANIQRALIDCGYPIDDDDTYKAFDLDSFIAFTDRLSQLAIFAAQNEMDLGDDLAERSETIFNAGDEFPYEYYEEAFMWLKRSGRPLFAPQPYKELNVTTIEFFEILRESHVDAARKKIEICRHIKDQGGDDEAAYLMIRSVLEDHFRYLGITDIDKDVAARIGCDMEEFDALHKNFCQKYVQETLPRIPSTPKNASDVIPLVRKSDNDNEPDYNAIDRKIIQTSESLLEIKALRDDPETWVGTGYTKDSFDTAFETAIKRQLRVCLTKIRDDYLDPAGFYQVLEEIEHLRSLCAVDDGASEGAPPELFNDDFWMYQIFQEFGAPTKTKFIDECCKRFAATRINDRLNTGDDIVARDQYDQLIEAENLLMDARVPMGRPDLIEALGIDFDRYREAFTYTAYDVANREWGNTFAPDISAKKRIEALESARVAYQRYVGIPELEKQTEFDGDDILDRERILILRRVEEHLAQARICFDKAGAYEVLHPAFAMLEGANLDLLDPHVQEDMGMAYPETAQMFVDWHRLLEIENIWLQSESGNIDFADRLELHVKFLKKLEVCSPEEALRITDRIDSNYVEIIMSNAHALARQAYAWFTQAEDDPMYGADSLRLVQAAMEAVHPDALTNDFIFARYFQDMGVSRSDLKAQIDEYKRRAERLTQPIKKQFQDVAGYGARLLEAKNPENAGENALEIVRDLSRELRGLGRSLNNPIVLDAAEFTDENLQKFVDEQIIVAARNHIRYAQDKKNTPLDMHALDSHAAGDYGRALDVMMLSSFPPFGDEMYQRLGFAGRRDFIDHFKESILDCVSQLEDLVKTNAMQAGPEKLITVLREIYKGKRFLGLEDDGNGPANDDVSRIFDGVSDVSIRHIFTKIGYVAIKQILNAKLPDGDYSIASKYKKLKNLMGFANEVGATEWSDQRKADEVNQEYSSLIRARIERVVDTFEVGYNESDVRPHAQDPGHRVRTALAINSMAQDHSLEAFEWFQDIFREHRYESFAHFCDMAAEARVRQIVQRVNKSIDTSPDAVSDTLKYVDIYHDLDRLNELLDRGLISQERFQNLLTMAGANENWPHLAAQSAMIVALPTFVERSYDPSLSVEDRETAIETAYKGYMLLGQYGGINLVMGVDWDAFLQSRQDYGIRVSGMCLANNVLFHDLKSADTMMSLGLKELNKIGLSFHNTEVLLQMGLNDDEAARVLYLSPYAELVRVMSVFDSIPEADVQARGEIVATIYQYMKQHGIDLSNEQVAREINYETSDALVKKLDMAAMALLKVATYTIGHSFENPQHAQVTAQGMLDYMEIIGIEERHPENTFVENAVFLRSELEAVKQRAEGTLATARRYDPRAVAAHPN